MVMPGAADGRESEALRAVKELALATAHEINNPLTVIIAELQLLARNAPLSRERLALLMEAADRIRVAVGRMNHINRLERVESRPPLPSMLDLERSSRFER